MLYKARRGRFLLCGGGTGNGGAAVPAERRAGIQGRAAVEANRSLGGGGLFKHRLRGRGLLRRGRGLRGDRNGGAAVPAGFFTRDQRGAAVEASRTRTGRGLRGGGSRGGLFRHGLRGGGLLG